MDSLAKVLIATVGVVGSWVGSWYFANGGPIPQKTRLFIEITKEIDRTNNQFEKAILMGRLRVLGGELYSYSNSGVKYDRSAARFLFAGGCFALVALLISLAGDNDSTMTYIFLGCATAAFFIDAAIYHRVAARQDAEKRNECLEYFDYVTDWHDPIAAHEQERIKLMNEIREHEEQNGDASEK